MNLSMVVGPVFSTGFGVLLENHGKGLLFLPGDDVLQPTDTTRNAARNTTAIVRITVFLLKEAILVVIGKIVKLIENNIEILALRPEQITFL